MKKLSVAAISAVCIFIATCNDNPADSGLQPYQWPISDPASQNISPQTLDSAFIAAEQLGFVDGIVVVRHGYIVAEAYFNGYDQTTPHNIMSVTKSFMSAVTGIALDKGYIGSLDEKMLDYFPEYIYRGIDRRKYDITLEHLLTMRMGIEDETINFFEIYNTDNWLKSTIEYPLAFSPGERFRYNSFEVHLLSAIIAKASRTSTREFAQKHLTDPMGLTIDYWQQGPQGFQFGGSGLFITPREMAMLGLMYLHGGYLNGTQIVPQEWVEFSLTPSTNLPANEWGAFKNYNYAYLWWLGQMNGHDIFMAYGYGGQFVVVIPDLDLIVATTANSNVDNPTSTEQEWAIFDIISRYVVPATESLSSNSTPRPRLLNVRDGAEGYPGR